MIKFLETLNGIVGSEQQPTIYKNIVDLFVERFPNVPKNVIFSMLDARVANMINFNHVMIDESGHDVIPNLFTVIFMGSGMGKDKTFRTLDSEIFGEFNKFFAQKTDEIYNEHKKAYTEQVIKEQQLVKELKEKLTQEREIKDGKQDMPF